jgi:hypothetical protein
MVISKLAITNLVISGTTKCSLASKIAKYSDKHSDSPFFILKAINVNIDRHLFPF